MSSETQRTTLAEALAEPAMIHRLSSEQIQALRFETYNVLNALADAYVVARQHELTTEAFPKAFIGGLMNVSEVARCLDIKKANVYEMLRTGELPSVRIGKYRKVPMAAFTHYFGRLISEAEMLRRQDRRSA